MSMEIKIQTYWESVILLLQEKQREAERKMEYWRRRARGKSPLVKEFERACDYGFEAECYKDLITMVKESGKI